MKNYLLFLPILIGMSLTSFSQSTIKIIDLTVNNTTYVDTTGAMTNNTGLDVNFKISNLSTANKAEIYIGTQADLGDVKIAEAVFLQNGSDYLLSYNGEEYAIVDGMANISVELSQAELDTYNYITVYVEDNQGLNTVKLYFNKQ